MLSLKKLPESAEDDRYSHAFLGVECSVLGRRWRLRLTDDQAAFGLAQALGLPEALARILAGRGVSLHQAQGYLAPALKDDLPDPSILMDMDAAAARLARAVMAGEEVALFADYDVDGATSAAILMRYLKSAGRAPRVYIPNRLTEGYGPTPEAMTRLAREGAKLIVTLDCGTKSLEALEAAAAAGAEVVVIDHHIAGGELPRAAALVNPNRPGEQPGLGHLCTAGLAFLLIVALNRRLRALGHFAAGKEPDLMSALDLVALGTVCDVVPLTGLNRTFVTQGLKVMRQLRNPGIAALAAVARINEISGPYELGFLIGPRINAGGRLGDSALGYRLLTTEDPQEARRIAVELDRLNRERRAIEADVEAEAVAEAERQGPARAVLTLAAEGWHPGVVGIVAGRIKERFKKPAIVLGIEGEKGDRLAKGSGRSVKGVDLGHAVAAAEAEGLLVRGGGHAMAVGLTAEEARIAALAAFLEEQLGEACAAASARDALEIDAALSVGGANPALLSEIERGGPYGTGNPAPVLAIGPARIAYVAPAGQEHLRVVLEGASGGRLRAVAFRSVGTPLGDLLAAERDRWCHFAGTLKADNWAGANGIQLVIEDAALI